MSIRFWAGICCASLLALAQDGPVTTPAIFPPPPDLVLPYKAVTDYLGLSAAQLDTLRRVQQQRREAEAAIYRQMSEKQRTIEELLRSNTMDALRVGQLTLEINALRRQLPLNDGPYREQALAALTEAQKQRLPGLVQALKLQQAGWEAVDLSIVENPNQDNDAPVRILRYPASVEAGAATNVR
ncbi:MAG: hypothetical protein SFV54_02345 [Bryobacteraceae bacterium]|nr:hypothetical protein [Bryobacteraceae bacterium]